MSPTVPSLNYMNYEACGRVVIWFYHLFPANDFRYKSIILWIHWEDAVFLLTILRNTSLFYFCNILVWSYVKKNSILIKLRAVRVFFFFFVVIITAPFFSPHNFQYFWKRREKSKRALVQAEAKRMLQKHLPKWGNYWVGQLLSLS